MDEKKENNNPPAPMEPLPPIPPQPAAPASVPTTPPVSPEPAALAPAPAPIATPPSPSTTFTPKLKENLVNTYAGDVAKVIAGDQGGSVRKILQEEERHEREKLGLTAQGKRNRLLMALSIALMIFSLAIVAFLYVNRKPATVDVPAQFSPMIFTDRAAFLEVADLKKSEIIASILNEANIANVKKGGVEGIYITLNKKLVWLRQFMGLLESNLDLKDPALVEDNFLLGFANENSRDVFILFKVGVFFDVFNLFHSWEGKMFNDMHDLFGIPLTPETGYLLTEDFTDGVVQNKNARILYDKDKKIVMMYVFADDSHLMLANSEAAVREVMTRLAGSQIRK